jgi:hypothetical protein
MAKIERAEATLIHAADKRVTQTLASGTIIRQDFRTATRFVFFDTSVDEWQWATDGGTLFVVAYRGKPYAITCRHVFKSFDWGQLIVTTEQFGGTRAPLRYIAYPSSPIAAAIDTDLMDVAVIQFDDDVDLGLFEDKVYLIDDTTVTTSNVGDALHVHGALKTPSHISEETIAPKFGLLELVDDTPSSNDPTLRRGFGLFDRPEFQDVVGLSGSPVFNVTRSALCGVVVRGTMARDACTLWYVDMFDICRLLASVSDGRTSAYYHKTQTSLVRVPSEK